MQLIRNRVNDIWIKADFGCNLTGIRWQRIIAAVADMVLPCNMVGKVNQAD